MKKLHSLIAWLRFHYLMFQVDRIDAAQRQAVSDMLFSVDCRMYAHKDFTERSRANAERKRVLLEKLDAIQGDI